MATTNQTNLINIATAAERLGVSVRYIRRLIDEKRIPYIKLGHFIRFDPDTIEAWINDLAVATRPTPGHPDSSHRAVRQR